MKKVITYGTYDLLHHGHIRLLERAKALGDYLIVGVTSDDFDIIRGKINVQQSLEERVAAVQATGIADKVIIEEYEGQKIDDIRKYGVNVFTVGSDWVGVFDYLNEFCKVVYLPRTEGVSSSEIREAKSGIKLGLVGYSSFLNKFYKESTFVNAVNVMALCTDDLSRIRETADKMEIVTKNYEAFLDSVDAVYIHSNPQNHYEQCKIALEKGKHVLCESPIAKKQSEFEELLHLSEKKHCILMEGIRTAYLTAYARLLLLLKAGKIGKIASVDVTCTSLSTSGNFGDSSRKWGALESWGSTALLPVFQILGSNYSLIDCFSIPCDSEENNDGFTKLNINYADATATIKVGTSIKAESELIISGTKGYAYVPAPWWKTDYFELRYEDSNRNKRYFYQVEGEGIRYELVQLARAIHEGNADYYIDRETSRAIVDVFETVESVKNEYNFKTI